MSAHFLYMPLTSRSMRDVKEAMCAWREASDAARVAENVLARMWEDYMNRTGPAPSAEQIAEVSELRREVDGKLSVVVALIGNR
jgi:ferric-dicitrate binding protein FerR (iron transport regulator)